MIELILIILFSLFYRLILSIYSYSGEAKPPLFGDYEAQRHWQEITYNLPMKEWYFNTTNNDLLYWGLDYPPLTAYHSYILGVIANKINPKYVELFKSRGFESYEHKLFMKSSVLIADLLIFFTSSILLAKKLNNLSMKQHLLLILMNPTLILIDYCHFQYNSMSLGLMQFAIYFILNNSNLIASIFFVLSLNYKQMQLYHSLPIFFYLLKYCLRHVQNDFKACMSKLFKLSLVVLLTFVICWLPFIHSHEQIHQLLHRLFPFSRGLFEDKVANFWCSISILFKIKDKLSIGALSKLSLLTTIIGALPSCLHLFFKQSKHCFILCLVNCSMIFYLFSFQVHEKTILLATIPVCLLITSYPFLATWFLVVATFSMFPLIYKDNAIIPYFCSCTLFVVLVQCLFTNNFWCVLDEKNEFFKKKTKLIKTLNGLFVHLFYFSILIAITLSLCQTFMKSPFQKLPDLWPVLISLFSFIHFVTFTVIFHLMQFTLVDNNQFKSSLFKSYNLSRVKIKTK